MLENSTQRDIYGRKWDGIEKDYDENWECPHCGSTIAWEREHTVSYTARVKELRKPRTVKLIGCDK